MLAVGGAILLAGYTLIWWGSAVRKGGTVAGHPVSLADLIVPGHFAKNQGGTSGSSTSSSDPGKTAGGDVPKS